MARSGYQNSTKTILFKIRSKYWLTSIPLFLEISFKIHSKFNRNFEFLKNIVVFTFTTSLACEFHCKEDDHKIKTLQF